MNLLIAKSGYRFRPIVLVALASSLLAGCSDHKAAAEKDEALAVLQFTLESWRAGQQLESLQNLDPPITVNDPAWRQGAKLSKFEIDEGESRAKGYDRSFRVKLWLDQAKKGPQKCKYTVSTSPAVVVVREFGG